MAISEKHYSLSSDSLSGYKSRALEQQKSYFALLQKNGYISKDVSYSDNALKNGIYRLMKKDSSELYNTRDLSTEHILAIQQDIEEKIASGEYVELDPSGFHALIQAALSTDDAGKRTGNMREILSLEKLLKKKTDLPKKMGSYTIVDTSPKGSFIDSIKYDIGVIFNKGLNDNEKNDSGILNQINLEIKANLDNFHITGFQSSTLLNNEVYSGLKKVVMQGLHSYKMRGSTIAFDNSLKFRRILAEWVIRWKLNKGFPIFFRIGELGGGMQAITCTQFIDNITGSKGVTDILEYNTNESVYKKSNQIDIESITPQELEQAKKKAADIAIMAVSRYDLWYGKK